MFKIKKLIEERLQWRLGRIADRRGDELLSYIVEDTSDDEVAFITLYYMLLNKRNIEDLQKEYNIIGVYNIGKPLYNMTSSFYVVHLSKKAPDGLKIALFNGKCYNSRPRENVYKRGLSAVPASYTEEWESYITQLETWMNSGDMPKSNELSEFKIVRKNDLYKESYIPETYSRENIKLRKLIAEQDTTPLSELAEILFPRIDSKNDNEVRTLSVRDFKYPLDVSEIFLRRSTNIILRKGDVLIPRYKSAKAKPYLFNYEGKEQIYASPHLIVIRCRNILPEYLYLYLNSDIALKVLNLSYLGTVIQHISGREVADFPIAVPTHDNKKYISEFNTLTNSGVRDYGQLRQQNDYYKQIAKKKDKPRIVEDILDIELANKIKAYSEDQLRTFLTDDLRELNTCFRGKAYKATLILAGSILEAVLIDWLSEINGLNYFEEDYYTTDRNGREKRAELLDYIDAIKYIRRPRWTAEANKAHLIRKKRNLVHAKLCMQSDDINEDVCRQVISYLTDVLKTRGVTSNQ